MRIRFNVAPGNAFLKDQEFMKKVELAQIKKQIEVLATFLPDEILEMKQQTVGMISEYVGVLLFADVSGFTQLTEKYNKTGKGGIYRLTATLNAYIGAIVEVLYFYGGDVLKFSGDAFLALWKVKPDESLTEILHGVVVCALVIQQALGRFETEINVELKVKLAISCGNMTFCVIGNDDMKHYAISGEAIKDVKEAEHISTSGDVVISPSAWAHMITERYEITSAVGGNVKVWKVIYKPSEFHKKLYFDEKQLDVLKLIHSHLRHRHELHANKNFDSSLTDSKITEQFIRSLPQRTQMKLASRNWIVEELRPFITMAVQDQVDESQPVEYLTEMREITIQFINIVPCNYYDPGLLELVDKAYQIVCRIAGSALGELNKVSLFDKDIMILVLFGLRAINHEMESQNALKSAYRIFTQIRKLRGVKTVSIGITNGFVYCGVVGHPMRREFTVIGGAVNKAARLMCSYIEKVTCDYKSYKYSNLSSFYFQLQSAVKLKGIEEAGNIFEYNENFDAASSTEAAGLPIVGRFAEYNFVRAVVYEPEKVDNYYGICFEGPAKIGKSKMLEYSLGPFKKNGFFSVASICLEASSTIPYFCVSKLYRQLYDNRTTIGSLNTLDIVNLPRDLRNLPEPLQNWSEDIALQKYRILNQFRDVTNFTQAMTTIIFIDNVEYIDTQSWEILEIVLNDRNIRLIMTGLFEEKFRDLRFKISINRYLKLVELRPLQSEDHVATIACQLLAVAGIPRSLVYLLLQSCEGRPGHMQCCLLRLINNGSIELELIAKASQNHGNYIFPDSQLTGHRDSEIIPIINFSEKYKKYEELTLAAISLDLFDSFTPYQQLVIKTGAVLGDLFTRTLLIVALKYPTEFMLTKVIQHLFEEKVLDCGSRYIYASEIDNTNCCRCYFEEDFAPVNQAGDAVPRYAYCKILHFKNRSIRDVAYDLLPANQRKELHLLCTDVLENMSNQCPNCLRKPYSSFINLGKFNEIMAFCNNTDLPFNKAHTSEAYENMKECVRKGIKCASNNSTSLVYRKISDVIFTRSLYDIKLCNCFETLTRVYKDLIYHSEQAGHLGKQIFFSMQYGLLLILMKDFLSAIAVLTEARELCLKDAKLPNTHITANFRKLHVGKIELALGSACLSLRQMKAARNHLAIALRQYGIPTVALSYKHFNKLMRRSHLLHAKSVRPHIYKNTIIRTDLGICMGNCAKLFSLEGNWKLAKYAAAYSVYLLHSINSNIGVLYDIYCSAIDIYRYCSDLDTCQKLQKFTLRELQSSYSNDLTYNFYSLHFLINSIFEIRCMTGDLLGATRLGYRVLDIGLKMSMCTSITRIVELLSLLLVYTFRLKESADACSLLKRRNNFDKGNLVIYYSTCLGIYLRAGVSIEPLQDILAFAEAFFTNKTNSRWEEHLMIAMVHLHHLRMGNFLKAEEWRLTISFNSTNVKRNVVLRTLIYSTESKILLYLRSFRLNSPNVPLEKKVIDNLLKLVKEQVKEYVVYKAYYLCLCAWMEMLNKRKCKSYKILDKALKISKQQGNVMIECFIAQLKNAWSGGYCYHYDKRPAFNFKSAYKCTMREWAHYMTPFPLY